MDTGRVTTSPSGGTTAALVSFATLDVVGGAMTSDEMVSGGAAMVIFGAAMVNDGAAVVIVGTAMVIFGDAAIILSTTDVEC